VRPAAIPTIRHQNTSQAIREEYHINNTEFQTTGINCGNMSKELTKTILTKRKKFSKNNEKTGRPKHERKEQIKRPNHCNDDDYDDEVSL
jgi:hypothetical protein